MDGITRSILGCSLLLAGLSATAFAQDRNAATARPGGDTGAARGTDSPHGPMRIDLDCSACHTPNGWKPARANMEFDHNEQTEFILINRHAATGCGSCHLNLRFAEPKLDNGNCASCHVDVHQGKLSAVCATCHSTISFVDTPDLQLHARTNFPLTGSHLQITCESCHTNDLGGAFTPMNSECVSCHLDAYLSTSSSALDHQAAGFPTQCQQCHNTLAWTGGVLFDHLAASGFFALTGAHAQLRCASCHIPPGGQLQFTPSGQDDCVACHRDDYQREHGSDGFPTTCVDCHDDGGWGSVDFNHVQASGGYPLLGAHADASCSACHTQPGNQLIFAPQGQDDCVACHQADYQREHGSDGFPATCLDCHNNNDWGSANFSHFQASGGFPLLGAHLSAPCSACHTQPGNQLIFTPQGQNDCIACHQADYQQEHGGSGFPTTCLDCHTYDGWQGATAVDHDAQFFPIYSGKHQGKWNGSCQTCHIDPGNQQVFSCFSGCHEHDRTSMDDKHKNESGYAYDSNLCYSCHPDGRKD